VRKLSKDQLKPLAEELREYLTQTVSISGGHFSAAWHGGIDGRPALCVRYPKDQLVWTSAIRLIRTRS